MASTSTRKGVRLTLPGAPDVEHDIPGLFLRVRPHTTTPLETAEDVARAERLIEAGAPIEIVDADHDPEPWGGYRDQTADDIVKRLDSADTDTAAAVMAFERDNKNRSTVLDAAAARITATEEQ